MTDNYTTSPGNQSDFWFDALPVHPAVELFDIMSDAELKVLAEDIVQAKGLRNPIIIYVGEDGAEQLLDGRNRIVALERAGFKLVEDGKFNYAAVPNQRVSGVNPYDLALSLNLHRRHLDLAAKRKLIAKLLKLRPEASDRQIAKQVAVSHNTVKVIRCELEGRGQIDHVETRIDTNGRKQPATKPPKPTSAAETDPIHHADAAELNPADQAGAHHHGADQRAAGTELDDLDGEILIEAWEAAGDTGRRKIIQSLNVAALLDLMSADQRAALSEKIIGLQRHHSDFDAAKSEIVKLANESTAQLTHPAHNVDAIRKKLARIISLTDPDRKLRGAKPVAEKPLNTTLAHDAIKAANEAIAASSTTKH